MTHIEDLLQRVNVLHDLLIDPHPGLSVWRAAYEEASERVLNFYGVNREINRMYDILMMHIGGHLYGAGVGQAAGSIPDATGHSGDLNALLDEISAADAKNGYGAVPDATGHSGDAICPECGSADPKAHYVPHDAYKACENIWHITEVRIPRRDR